MHLPSSLDIEIDNAQPFRLLDLPPELWSKIGKLVIHGEPVLDNDALEMHEINVNTLGKPSTITESPSITRVCRVVRGELLPYYYTTKIHCFALDRDIILDISAWIERIGTEHRRIVRGVYLVLPTDVVEGEMDEAVARYRTLFRVDFKLAARVPRSHGDLEMLHEIEFL